MSEDDDFYLVEGTAVENFKEVFAFGKDMIMVVLVLDKVDEVGKVGFVEFFLEHLSPAFFYINVHNRIIINSVLIGNQQFGISVFMNVQITSLTHDGYSEVLLYSKESLENLFGDGMNLREGMFGRD